MEEGAEKPSVLEKHEICQHCLLENDREASHPQFCMAAWTEPAPIDMLTQYREILQGPLLDEELYVGNWVIDAESRRNSLLQG